MLLNRDSTLNQYSNNKLKVVLIIAYYLFAQYSYIGGNHISKIILLAPLMLLIDIKNFPVKMYLLIGVIPLMLGVNLLLEEKSTIEGWELVNIHIGAAIFSLIVINSSLIKNNLPIEKLLRIIFYFGMFIIISTFIEHILGQHPGRLIFGSQNLTSLTLALTIPLVFLSTINNKVKFTYIVLLLFSIAFLIKSRGISVISLLVIFYYLYNDFRALSKYIRIGLLFLLTASFLGALFIFNQRFEELLFGNSLYLRLQAWQRIIYTIIETGPFFGYGPSNIVINFNNFQFINPQIELITFVDTFYNPHSDWLFMFASGGLVLLLLYLILHIFIILKYVNYSRKRELNKYLNAIFVCYLISIASAQYDINNTTYATLLSFYLLQGLLIKNIVQDNTIIVNQFFIKIFLSIILLLSLISQSNSLNLTKKYQEFVYSQLFSESFVGWGFDKYASHFKITDTLKAYHYLNVSRENFNDETFDLLIQNARRYNKYLEPSLHLSAQYFSFKKSENRLLDVYSDVLYKLLVSRELINISASASDVKVVVGDELGYQVNQNSHKLTLTPILFSELIRSNSSFGKYMIEDFNKFSFNTNAGASNSLIYKNIPYEFLIKLSNYSVPLKM